MENKPEEPTLAQDEEVLGDLSDMGKGEENGNA
jgi:hypothetical protein